jgi:hypothetical protein
MEYSSGCIAFDQAFSSLMLVPGNNVAGRGGELFRILFVQDLPSVGEFMEGQWNDIASGVNPPHGKHLSQEDKIGNRAIIPGQVLDNVGGLGGVK